MPRQTRPHKALNAYFRPQDGDVHETRQVGRPSYRADIIHHQQAHHMVKYDILFAGPNLDNIADIETAHNAQQVDEEIASFAIHIHQERRCKCGWNHRRT